MNRLAGRWRGRRVIVLGDAMLDRWLHGAGYRLCREAPAPVVDLDHVEEACGGAANTAINLAALGADAILVAPAGRDDAGGRLRVCLRAGGVHDEMVTTPGRRTITKTRILADGHLLARVDDGSTERLSQVDTRRLRDRLTACLRGADALIVCDYGAGAVTDGLLDWLCVQRSRLPLLVVDAHDLARWRLVQPTVATPSFAELSRMWPVDGTGAASSGADRAALVSARANDVLTSTRAAITAVTLDVDGSVVIGADALVHRTRAEPVPASQTVGAGDVYTAAFTLGLLAGAAPGAAADLAQSAATTATRGPGTSVCHLADLTRSTVDDAPLAVGGGAGQPGRRS